MKNSGIQLTFSDSIPAGRRGRDEPNSLKWKNDFPTNQIKFCPLPPDRSKQTEEEDWELRTISTSPTKFKKKIGTITTLSFLFPSLSLLSRAERKVYNIEEKVILNIPFQVRKDVTWLAGGSERSVPLHDFLRPHFGNWFWCRILSWPVV